MLNTCAYRKHVERWFDGESCDEGIVRRHLEGCPSCGHHVAFLKRTRRGVQATMERASIQDAQLPSFMNGIRQQVEARPNRRHTGFWALASVACAAIVAAGSLYYTISGGPAPVGAEIVVESHGTEIEGASTRLLESTDGSQTLWVDIPVAAWEYNPEGDMM